MEGPSRDRQAIAAWKTWAGAADQARRNPLAVACFAHLSPNPVRPATPLITRRGLFETLSRAASVEDSCDFCTCSLYHGVGHSHILIWSILSRVVGFQMISMSGPLSVHPTCSLRSSLRTDPRHRFMTSLTRIAIAGIQVNVLLGLWFPGLESCI
jgi:hypothetical protein